MIKKSLSLFALFVTAFVHADTLTDTAKSFERYFAAEQQFAEGFDIQDRESMNPDVVDAHQVNNTPKAPTSFSTHKDTKEESVIAKPFASRSRNEQLLWYGVWTCWMSAVAYIAYLNYTSGLVAQS